MASNETSEVPKQPKVPTGDEDEKIAYPLGEVYRHTMLRGAGLGSFAATVVGTPFLLYRGARGVLLFKRLGKISLLGTVSHWPYCYNSCLLQRDSVRVSNIMSIAGGI